jgi:hypothetical protein
MINGDIGPELENFSLIQEKKKRQEGVTSANNRFSPHS